MDDRVGVFVELGVPGGRTGARSEDEAVAVAGAVGASARLRLVGVEGYEGLLAPDRSPQALATVDEYLDGLRRLTRRLADAGAFSSSGPSWFLRREPVLRPCGGHTGRKGGVRRARRPSCRAFWLLRGTRPWHLRKSLSPERPRWARP